MRHGGWVALAFLAVGGIIPHASSQDMTFRDEAEEAAAFNVTRTTKTVAGLNFRVEEDRPIEKVGGIYRPIDIDSYVALKINKLQQQMQEQIDGLSARLDTLTTRVEALDATRIPPQAPAPAANATAANVTAGNATAPQPPAVNATGANVTVTPGNTSNQTVTLNKI